MQIYSYKCLLLIKATASQPNTDCIESGQLIVFDNFKLMNFSDVNFRYNFNGCVNGYYFLFIKNSNGQST